MVSSPTSTSSNQAARLFLSAAPPSSLSFLAMAMLMTRSERKRSETGSSFSSACSCSCSISSRRNIVRLLLYFSGTSSCPRRFCSSPPNTLSRASCAEPLTLTAASRIALMSAGPKRRGLKMAIFGEEKMISKNSCKIQIRTPALGESPEIMLARVVLLSRSSVALSSSIWNSASLMTASVIGALTWSSCAGGIFPSLNVFHSTVIRVVRSSPRASRAPGSCVLSTTRKSFMRDGGSMVRRLEVGSLWRRETVATRE
mmetsp:Transcript_13054/g.23686  ORF Transcript_13054/g.23686 Transcript_13054/m.23686 type:complete len:257 (-) Transcript_13054:1175-1945(-)